MRPRDDGFTRSTARHSHGPDVNTTSTLRHLEPYVARFQVCASYRRLCILLTFAWSENAVLHVTVFK